MDLARIKTRGMGSKMPKIVKMSFKNGSKIETRAAETTEGRAEHGDGEIARDCLSLSFSRGRAWHFCLAVWSVVSGTNLGGVKFRALRQRRQDVLQFTSAGEYRKEEKNLIM